MIFINQVKGFVTSPWGIFSMALLFSIVICIKLFSEK